MPSTQREKQVATAAVGDKEKMTLCPATWIIIGITTAEWANEM